MKIKLAFALLALLVVTAPATAQTFSCLPDGTNCSAAIPDANGATPGVLVSTLTVPADVCTALPSFLGDVDVDVDVTHEWVGDLRVRVIAPNATAVTLVDRPVNAGDCGSDDIDTSFSDGGALFPCAPTIPASGTAPVAPVAPLSSLLSGPVAGAWSLEITDFANSGIGALEDWAVTFTCGTTPTVTVATVDGTGNEAGDPIVFRVTRSVVSVTPLTVFLTLSGSAGPADYQAVTLPVTIPGGAGFVDLTIVPVEDIVPEPAETVIVTVNAGAGYIVGSPDAASATIEADPIAVPLLDPLGMAITIVLLAMAGFVALSRIRM